MKMYCAAIFLAFLSCAVDIGIGEPLNLADVPCGNMPRDSRRLFQRIMGGSVADISDFPYAVSLKKHGKHHCGGSLVSVLPSRRFKTGGQTYKFLDGALLLQGVFFILTKVNWP